MLLYYAGVQIIVTPAVEAQCRARGIDRADIDYALANPQYETAVKGLPGVRQIVAHVGRGRLFLKYSKTSETQGTLVEGYWNPRK